MKILVTGGGGFIGLNLIERLIDLNKAKVRVIDNFERTKNNNHSILQNNNIELINIDLRNKLTKTKLFEDIDIVVHLASRVGGVSYYRKYPADIFLDNTLIDLNVLQAARHSNVRGYIYASSAYVYPLDRMQDPFSEAIKENETISACPAVSYGWVKLLGEQAIKYTVEQDNKFSAAILRLANPYGPYQSINLDRGSIIPVLIRRAIEYSEFKPYTIFGTGKETRSFCYISDVIDAMMIAIENMESQKLIGPLNIGSENRIRIVDLAKKVIEISGKDITLEKLSASAPITMSQTLNCKLAKSILNEWEPQVALEDGLKKMYSHIEKQLEK